MTPFMQNLDKIQIMAKQEIGFIKVIVKPLWVLVNNFLDNYLDDASKNCDDNIKEWENLQEGN